MVVPSYGHLRSTAEHVGKILKASKCPMRLTVIVVTYGTCADTDVTQGERNRSVLQRLTTSSAFRGVSESFSLAEHVVEIHGGEEPMGDYVALAHGVTELLKLRKLDTVCFMGSHTAPCSNWDELLVHNLLATPTPTATVLSYAVTSATMHAPSFPVLSANDGYPLLAWTQFNTAPMTPHPARHLSLDFLCFTLPQPEQQGPALVRLLGTLPCPPKSADLLLGLFLTKQLGLALYHPMHLIVTGMATMNYSRMFALMRKDGSPQQAANTTTTQRLSKLLVQHASELSFDASGRGATYEALMGLRPSFTAGQQELEEDTRIKYGSAANCAKTWKSVARQCKVLEVGNKQGLLK